MILFNCFVMVAISDDMIGTFKSLKEAAFTMQKGGGIGLISGRFARKEPRSKA